MSLMWWCAIIYVFSAIFTHVSFYICSKILPEEWEKSRQHYEKYNMNIEIVFKILCAIPILNTILVLSFLFGFIKGIFINLK